jgi:chaperonin GroES
VPIADRVLVKRVEHKTQTASGIYLPTEQKVNEAEVISVGPGALDEAGKLLPMDVAVGDSVLLPEYGATLVTLGEEEFHLLRAADILGKFEN